MTELTPDNLLDGRYRVIETLGQGTFGHTVLAEEVKDGRRVAIKSLRPEKAAGLKAYELFDREAKVLGELRHQGRVRDEVVHESVPSSILQAFDPGGGDRLRWHFERQLGDDQHA